MCAMRTKSASAGGFWRTLLRGLKSTSNCNAILLSVRRTRSPSLRGPVIGPELPMPAGNWSCCRNGRQTMPNCRRLSRGGAVYEMNYHADAANWAAFYRTWERLRWIAAAFPMNVPINVQTAKGAYQAYVSYLRISESKKRDNAWLWLERIDARFPSHPEIAPLVQN